MNPLVIALLVFACAFGGALLGLKLHGLVPDAHLGEATKDTVKLGFGLVATMTALILGLVTASAKDTFDELNTALKHTAAQLLSFDRVLARYGPETAPIRASLKRAVAARIEESWHARVAGASGIQRLAATAHATDVELLATQINLLSPTTAEQKWLQARAVAQSETLLDSRWTIFASLGTSVPVPFLAMLLFWLTVTFASFGLFAPHNSTVVSVLFVCAVSVAGAVFLILELDGPFDGLIRISDAPLGYALEHLNQ